MPLQNKTGLSQSLHKTSIPKVARSSWAGTFVDLLEEEFDAVAAPPSGSGVQLVGNSNATILSTTNIVLINAALGAGRIYTLPSANAVPAGWSIQFIDLQGGNWFLSTQPTIAAAAGDSVWWGSTTSVALPRGFRAYEFISDGVSRWPMTYPILLDEMGTVTGSGTAASGKLGEYIDSGNVTGVTPGASNVSTNVTSISIPAGDWDVFGYISMAGSPTGVQWFFGGPTTSSGGSDATWRTLFNWPGPGQSLGDWNVPFPTKRLGLSSTTTLFLTVNVVYSGAPTAIGGRISARRVR